MYIREWFAGVHLGCVSVSDGRVLFVSIPECNTCRIVVMWLVCVFSVSVRWTYMYLISIGCLWLCMFLNSWNLRCVYCWGCESSLCVFGNQEIL